MTPQIARILVRIHPFNVNRISGYVNDSLEKKISVHVHPAAAIASPSLVVAMPAAVHKGLPGSKECTRAAASAAGKPLGAALDALKAASPRSATELPEDGQAIIVRRHVRRCRLPGARLNQEGPPRWAKGYVTAGP